MGEEILGILFVGMLIPRKVRQYPLNLYPKKCYTPNICFWTDTIKRGADAVGMIIPPPANTESGDQEISWRSQLFKVHIFMGGGGYKAARGLISRDVTSVKLELYYITIH